MKKIEIVKVVLTKPEHYFVTEEGITVFRQAGPIFPGRLYVGDDRVLYKPHPMAQVVYDLGSLDDTRVMSVIFASPNKEALKEIEQYLEEHRE